MASIPAGIQSMIQNAVKTTQTLAIARQTDSAFGGHRYEAEAFMSNKSAIEQAWQTLAKIEQQAIKLNLSKQDIYGNNLPVYLSDAAAEMVANW